MAFLGKRVMLTGASSGIGWALAQAFAAMGAQVGVLARREDRLRELCEEIRVRGGTCSYAVADAMDRDQVRTALATLSDTLGPCDILVANAGLGGTDVPDNLNVPDAERVIRTNLLGPIYAFDAVLPSMLLRGGGHLVGISSMAAFKGLPTSAAYCASKAGLNGYLESIRISLRSRNIAVTAICPGFVRTPMTVKNPKMPWLLEPEAAAQKILRAIAKRKKVYSFPKRMRWLIELTRWLPDWLVAKVLADSTAHRNAT